ncbi:Rps23 Pro-64 3,4-dihydroxylase Tpa1-like proline 4-hydroxylase [Nitrobacter vulgaris]|uniref:2OG-Fe(II) oxygenase n=1 Tax=Nitrobacter vulgaris TaxID=29421 RepID=UPI00285C4D25|nr:2OG-Fe(II) oxygenase [Nitrobacter vulgaris]MDR6304502.1 Rps23 Pro-64 3,4-dihydroxylase Tpa1-like proline 4-hydroxylase [Nitrobacter vulgaris]
MKTFAVAIDLHKRAEVLRDEYLNAKPWPHVVVANGFPDDFLDEIADEVANIDQSHIISSLDVRQIKQEASQGFGPATQHFFDLVDGESFREFISTVTGVDNLLSDPSHKLAGAHRTPPGGYTKIHRDFEMHPDTGLFHRVNLLVYLNRDWPDSYGGSLELWPTDMSAIGRRVFPRFNTMVLWETHGGTLHGLPDPVRCPPNRMRLSVASYYYTKECRPAAAGERRGGRYWAARPEDDRSIEHVGWLDRARSVTPEPLKFWFRAARDQLVRRRPN